MEHIFAGIDIFTSIYEDTPRIRKYICTHSRYTEVQFHKYNVDSHGVLTSKNLIKT